MALTRRGFLRVGAAAAAAAALPFSLPKMKPIKPKDFDPGLEYGNSLAIASINASYNECKPALEILIRDARKVLPRGTRFEIRQKIPSDYGRSNAMAWYTGPRVRQGVKRLGLHKPVLFPEHGFLSWGYLRA